MRTRALPGSERDCLELLEAALGSLAPGAAEMNRLAALVRQRAAHARGFRPRFSEAKLAGGDLALRSTGVEHKGLRHDDLTLARAAVSGDERAWEEIVRTYSRGVRGLIAVKWRAFAATDGDDLLQDILIKVYTGLPSYEGVASLKTWIYRIAQNHLINHARNREYRGKHEVLESQLSADGTVSIDAKAVSQALSGADAVHDRERRQIARRILGELDERYRQVIVFTQVCGCSYDETAQILDVEEGTIKSRMARARKVISQKMQTAGI